MTQTGKPAVVVVIPVYNEADGIGGFLAEIDRALIAHVRELRLLVVDDSSTDETAAVLRRVAGQLQGTLEVITNPVNRGHGPSLMAGYRRALKLHPDFVLQVDGDGQFHGRDLRRILVLLIDDARTVSGVRRFRQDPWFRMVMTSLLRAYVRLRFSVRARDPNCPLRGYDAGLLAQLLTAVPADAVIPNVYLTILAARRGVPLMEVDVSHRLRRGESARGVTWGSGGSAQIPWRLVRFSLQALRESVRFRAQMDLPHWAREEEDDGSAGDAADEGAPEGRTTRYS